MNKSKVKVLTPNGIGEIQEMYTNDKNELIIEFLFKDLITITYNLGKFDTHENILTKKINKLENKN
jgi:hypothetical protein